MKTTEGHAINAIAAAVRRASTAADLNLISEARAALHRRSYATAFKLAERVGN